MREIKLEIKDLIEVNNEWEFINYHYTVKTLEALDKLIEKDTISVIYPINLGKSEGFVKFIVTTTNNNILIARADEVEQTTPDGRLLDPKHKIVIEKISKDIVKYIKLEENLIYNGKFSGDLNLEIAIDGYDNLVLNSDRDSFEYQNNIGLRKETMKGAIIKIYNELN